MEAEVEERMGQEKRREIIWCSVAAYCSVHCNQIQGLASDQIITHPSFPSTNIMYILISYNIQLDHYYT